MLIDRKKEILLQDATNALIGLGVTSESWIRWQAARLLIRWNALVIKGEDEVSPVSLKLKNSLDQWMLDVAEKMESEDSQKVA